MSSEINSFLMKELDMYSKKEDVQSRAQGGWVGSKNPWAW